MNAKEMTNNVTIRDTYHANTITNFFLAMIAFFLPWGEGMQQIVPYASYICLMFIFLLFVHNHNLIFDCKRYGFYYLPKQYKNLVIFVAIHTLLYVLINIDEISFGTTNTEKIDGFIFKESNNGQSIATYFFYLIFSVFLSFFFRNKKYRNTFVLYFNMGFCATILLGGFRGEYSGLVRFSGGLSDPNAMSFDSILSLLFSFYALKQQDNKKIKQMFYITSIVISVFALIMAFSRGAVLALCVCIIYYVYQQRLIHQIKNIIFFILFVYVALYFAQNFVSISLFEIFDTRFGIQEMSETGGSGRLDIWNSYIKNYEEYFILGTGMSNGISVMINNGFSVVKETHNQYLLYLVEFGVIGFFLYFAYIILIIKEVWKCDKNNLPLALIGIAMLCITFFLNTDKGRTFWVVIGIMNYLWYSNNIRKISMSQNLFRIS